MKQVHESLIRGKPLKIDRSLIYLPTLEEIFDLGVNKYLEYLQSIILDISELELQSDSEENQFSDYQIFLMLVLANKDFKNTFAKTFLGRKIENTFSFSHFRCYFHSAT